MMLLPSSRCKIEPTADLRSSPQSLKPILHALLVSGTLPTLSLVNNRRIKATGWRLLAAFLKKVSRFAPLLNT
jgi:hypothetical protein